MSNFMSLAMMLLMLLLGACASKVVLDPKGCEGQGVWLQFNDKEFDYDRYYDVFSPDDLKAKYDFVIIKNVKTTWGILREERVYLRPLLEQHDIRCHDVQGVTVTFHNQPWDVVLSFVPLLGSKTLYVYGTFWEKKKVMEDEEPGL